MKHPIQRLGRWLAAGLIALIEMHRLSLTNMNRLVAKYAA